MLKGDGMDTRFKAIIPPLAAEERAQLEQNILRDGIREPLVVWGDTLIDGHNRLAIAQEHGLPYDTAQMHFDSDSAAIEWIVTNQFGRRNINAFQRAELAMVLEPIIAEKARDNQRIYYGNQHEGGLHQKSDKVHTVTTNKETAKLAGISHDTYARAKKISTQAPPELVEQVRAGTTTINKAYQDIVKAEKAEARREELQNPVGLPEGVFQVIYCDPPWQYSNSGLNGSAEGHYPTMGLDELKALPVRGMRANNSVMFMWATNPMLKDALELMSAWGFEYKTNIAWMKERQGYGKLGFYVYSQHELLLIGTNGSMLPIGAKPASIITGKNDTHSKKPDSVYEIIETMYPQLKSVELFARNAPRSGWIKWGNEVGKHD